MPTRRRLLGSLGAGTAALAGCLNAEEESCPDGDLGRVSGTWSTRGGDPGHSGATAATGFGSKPEMGWCTELEGRFLSLVLADGTLFAVERTGSMGDRTYYLRADRTRDGRSLWRRELPDEPIAELAYDDGGLHLTMNADDADVVARYAASDGSQDWSVEFTDRTDSMPAAADGTVYVVDVAGSVHAYEAADGTERWTTTVSNRVNPALKGNVPAVVDGTVYVGTAIGKGPAALSAADGSVEWQRDLDDFFLPVTDGDVLLGTGEEALTAVAPASGDDRWSLSKPFGRTAPTVGDDAVYAFVDGDVAAYAASDGSKRWRRSPPDAVGSANALLATGDALVVAGTEGLVGVDPASGDGQWTFETEVDRFVVGDGVGFVSPVSGTLEGLAF